MNRPDKPGEPSMEEILASIRQIIADDPSTDQAEPVIEANPLVPQSHAEKTPDQRLPLADRLSGALRSGPLPPTSPLGSKRPLSFDQDLADMFDEQEPADGSSVSAPKPDLRVPAGLSHPMAPKPFVSTPETDVAKPLAAGAAALPPQFAPSESLVPPPFGNSTTPAEPAAPKAFGFPPLRKTSFYPPQPAKDPAPVFPPAHTDTPSGAPASEAEAPPAAAPAPATPVPDATQSPGEPGPFPASATSSAPGPGPAAAPAERAAATFATPEARTEDRSIKPASPSSSFVTPPKGAFSKSAAPAQPFVGAPDAFAAALKPAAAQPETPAAQPADTRPAEPRTSGNAFAAGSVRAPSGFAEAPPVAAEPDPTRFAAHQALDALAQGLAASAAASVTPADVSPAIPLTPVIEPERDFRAAPQPTTLPAPVAPAATAPAGRTLEDAVADMLRPMLQQWVADNMPRIIERALRTEVAKSVPPGQKPPGT